MTIERRYYLRPGEPAVLYRISRGPDHLSGEVLGPDGWIDRPDALGLEMQGEMFADPVTEDEAAVAAASIGATL